MFCEVYQMASRWLKQWARRAVLVTAVAVLGLLAAGCGGEAEAAGTAGRGKLQVVTTTGQIGDIARNVGGELVEVTALMGPGVDPHLYVASEGDVDRLVKA